MIYRSNIARQPEAISDCVVTAKKNIECLDLAAFKSGIIAITGIGASFSVATIVAAELQRRGYRAFAVNATNMVQCKRIADSIIALSHKGRSVEVVDAVAFQSPTPSLGISKDPDSPLASTAGLHLLLKNGSDSTPSSTGFTGSLAVAGVLVDCLCEGQNWNWLDVSRLLRETLSHTSTKMGRAIECFRGSNVIDCVGSRASLGTADMATLLIREAARIPAAAHDTRQYLHGPMEAVDSKSGIVVFGNDREVQMAHELRDAGCAVLLITSNQGVFDDGTLTVIHVPMLENQIVQALLDILPAQILAAELSDDLGLTDTKFRYIQTDTKIL